MISIFLSLVLVLYNCALDLCDYISFYANKNDVNFFSYDYN